MSQLRGRILCLEDDADTCELITLFLRPEGYEVVTVGTIAEALRLFREDHFDLLIVDEILPDGLGVEFCRKVRETDSITPILVHSAAASKNDIDLAMQAGANEYLVKPHGWGKLIKVVKNLLIQTHSSV